MYGTQTLSRFAPDVHDASPNGLRGKVKIANELALNALNVLAGVHEEISGPQAAGVATKQDQGNCFRSEFDLLLDRLRALNEGLDLLRNQFID